MNFLVVALAVCGLAAMMPAPLRAQMLQRAQDTVAEVRSGHAIRGRVVDGDGAAIVGAEVAILEYGDTIGITHSGSDGRFVLSGVAPGKRTVSVRRLGFHPREFDVRVSSDDSAARLTAELTAMPTELEEVRVEARIAESNGRLRQFYAHRERSHFGYFLDPDAIEARHPRFASELLRAVPGARLLPARGIGSAVRVRGCRPLLWIDGQRVPGAELDEAVNANDIAAMEVYNSFAGIPPQYVDRDSNCGAIVVWTKI